jgi:histidine ammonia-lyase
MPSDEALKLAEIEPFKPLSKEGLALSNGTSFMISMLTIGYLKQVEALNNLMLITNLFLDSIVAIDAAFCGCI